MHKSTSCTLTHGQMPEELLAEYNDSWQRKKKECEWALNQN